MTQIEVVELIYECTLHTTKLTEYGTSLAEVMAGKMAMPPEGVRVDAHFEGAATGEKLSGVVKGVDYLRARPDGRMELDVRAELTTSAGQKISFKADGVCTPQKGSVVAALRENITLFSSHEDYKWVNRLQVWAVGTIDLTTHVINLKCYWA